MYERIPGKSVAPQVVRLGRGIRIAPGEEIELDCPRASILNVAFRIHTSGTVNVAVEECQEDDGWQRTKTLEAAEGETVWHHILKKPVFRLRLTNPSDAGSVTVSVDANLPCRV